MISTSTMKAESVPFSSCSANYVPAGITASCEMSIGLPDADVLIVKMTLEASTIRLARGPGGTSMVFAFFTFFIAI